MASRRAPRPSSSARVPGHAEGCPLSDTKGTPIIRIPGWYHVIATIIPLWRHLLEAPGCEAAMLPPKLEGAPSLASFALRDLAGDPLEISLICVIGEPAGKEGIKSARYHVVPSTGRSANHSQACCWMTCWHSNQLANWEHSHMTSRLSVKESPLRNTSVMLWVARGSSAELGTAPPEGSTGFSVPS